MRFLLLTLVALSLLANAERNVTVDGTSSTISYGPGWSFAQAIYPCTYGAMGIWYTQQAEETVTFTFTGTAIYILGETHGSQALVTIDGQDQLLIPDIGPRGNRHDACATLFSKAGLANTHHTVTITAFANTSTQFELHGYMYTIPGNPPDVHNVTVEVEYNTESAQFTPQDVWTTDMDSCTGSRRTNRQSAVQISFTGIAIYVFGYLGSSTIATAMLDNELSQMSEPVNAESCFFLFSREDLSNGPHTLNLSTTQDARFYVGSYIYTVGGSGSDTNPNTGGNNSDNSKVAIIAGVVGGVGGVLLIFVLAFCLIRRRRRRLSAPPPPPMVLYSESPHPSSRPMSFLIPPNDPARASLVRPTSPRSPVTSRPPSNPRHSVDQLSFSVDEPWYPPIQVPSTVVHSRSGQITMHNIPEGSLAEGIGVDPSIASIPPTAIVPPVTQSEGIPDMQSRSGVQSAPLADRFAPQTQENASFTQEQDAPGSPQPLATQPTSPTEPTTPPASPASTVPPTPAVPTLSAAPTDPSLLKAQAGQTVLRTVTVPVDLKKGWSDTPEPGKYEKGTDGARPWPDPIASGSGRVPLSPVSPVGEKEAPPAYHFHGQGSDFTPFR